MHKAKVRGRNKNCQAIQPRESAKANEVTLHNPFLLEV